jgi:hypothetical protein
MKGHMMTTLPLRLTSAQLAFMLRHHDTIERALDDERRGNSQQSREVLKGLIQADEYQPLFGDMVWDDALDRYEDMPEYDDSLRKRLLEQLEKDMRAGFEPLADITTNPPESNGKTATFDPEKFGLLRLDEILSLADDR